MLLNLQSTRCEAVNCDKEERTMTALGSFLLAVAGLLNTVLTIFFWIVIARCILSFVSPDPRNQIVQIIYQITEPILAWMRRWIPPFGMFDLSALVVLLAVGFIQTFLVTLLQEYGEQLRIAGRAAAGL